MRKKYLTVILMIFIFCITGCIKSSSNIENYLNSGTPIDSKAKDIMPSLDDLPKYQSIAYKYTHKSLIFESKKKSIAYLYFYDTDLDYIGEKNAKNPMANFVKEYFDYNF